MGFRVWGAGFRARDLHLGLRASEDQLDTWQNRPASGRVQKVPPAGRGEICRN